MTNRTRNRILTPGGGNRGVLLAGLLLLGLPGAAPAQTVDETCNGFAMLAGATMEARQAGVALRSALATTNGNELLRRIVIDAYQRPRMSVPANRTREVEDFRTEWHLACLEAHETGQ